MTKLYKSGDKYYVYDANSTTYMLQDNGSLVSVKEATNGTDYNFVGHVFELVSSAKDSNGVITGTRKVQELHPDRECNQQEDRYPRW